MTRVRAQKHGVCGPEKVQNYVKKKEERGQGRKTTSLFIFILAALGNFSSNKNPAKHYCKITYYGKKNKTDCKVLDTIW